MLQDTYVDIHIHSTIKPLLTKYTDNIWHTYDSIENETARGGAISRSDFTQLIEANVRVVGLSLHAPERYVLNNFTTRPFILAKALDVELARLRQIWLSKPFKLLQEELNLLKSQLKSPDGKYYAVIAKNYNHLQEIIKDPNAIAIVLTIEGSHNLGLEYRDDKFPIYTKISVGTVEPAEPLSEELILERIEFMKKEHVFFLTLNHFVYHHLATQARAVEVTGFKKVAKNPIKSLDIVGKYRGLTYLGKFFVEACYENNILIDVKHCDAVSRKQIYKIAEKYNKPVIGSHMAVSGRESNCSENYTLIKYNDSLKDRKQSKTFNPWDINLHDDDIIAIHKSGGLIGLILDKRILGSVKEEKLSEENHSGIRLFFNQIKHIYQVLTEAGINPQNAFDSIVLGSDYDGFIEPIKGITKIRDIRYIDGKDDPEVPKLDKDLTEIIKDNYYVFKKSKLEPEEITHKILHKNAMNFFKNNWK